MKSTLFAVTAALLAGAEATNTVVGTGTGSPYWTTVVTTAFTTYCPSPTTFAYHNVTYTATSATTITVSDCPCTVSYSQAPPVTTTSYFAPPPTTYNGTIGVPTVYPNGSSTVITYTPTSTYLSGTTEITPPSYPTFTTSGEPTRIPIPPTAVPDVPGAPGSTTTASPPVVTAGAARIAGPAGALLAVGLAVFAL